MSEKKIQGSRRQDKDWSVFHMVIERTASTLKAKEQTAPASAAIAEIGPVCIRERSAGVNHSFPKSSHLTQIQRNTGRSSSSR